MVEIPSIFLNIWVYLAVSPPTSTKTPAPNLINKLNTNPKGDDTVSKFSNRELQMEYEQLLSLLNDSKTTYCKITPLEKGQLLVNVYVRPPEKSNRKMDFMEMNSVEVFHDLKDEDREVCSKVITHALNGLHWKCSKKGYNRENNTEYYIKPDWKYWYSLNK